MSNKILPQEIFEKILQYLPFEKVIYLSEYVSLKIYRNKYSKLITYDAEYLVEKGNIGILKWYYKNNILINNCLLGDLACEYGHLDIVKWIHETSISSFTKRAMDSAAMNGHIDIVKWLHRNRREGCSEDAMDSAAMNGHIDIVKWLHSNRKEGCSEDAMDFSAMNGHIEIFKWLHFNRKEGCSDNAFDWAIENEISIYSIKWMIENIDYVNPTTYAFEQTLFNDNLDILKILIYYFRIIYKEYIYYILEENIDFMINNFDEIYNNRTLKYILEEERICLVADELYSSAIDIMDIKLVNFILPYCNERQIKDCYIWMTDQSSNYNNREIFDMVEKYIE